MDLIIFVQLLFYIILISVNGEEKKGFKKYNPYFRQQVEEIENKRVSEKSENDDTRSNLVSFLLQNAKEIFNEAPDQTETNPVEVTTIDMSTDIPETTTTFTNMTPTHSSTTIIFTTPTAAFSTDVDTTKLHITFTTLNSSSILPSRTNDIMYGNISLTSSLDDSLYITEMNDVNAKNIIRSNDIKYASKTEKKEREIHIASPIRNYIGNAKILEGDHDPRRSCILCNNVASEDCNDPKNKLITSITCERDDDMCYSMHTPFGIIDRGCFNTNHNLTTYVCSCNLCNYISISEMPFTFDNKRGWSENVIEISRTRHFRKSVFKEMSCLKCEVNTTSDKGDVLDTANCLEGNVGNIPVEECKPNEICAVKALRADGYIWRGCLRAPLYNYWWSLCDYDLCNYDTIISLYDLL